MTAIPCVTADELQELRRRLQPESSSVQAAQRLLATAPTRHSTPTTTTRLNVLTLQAKKWDERTPSQ